MYTHIYSCIAGCYSSQSDGFYEQQTAHDLNPPDVATNDITNTYTLNNTYT